MTEVSTINVDEPMDLMKLSLNKLIHVKCRYNHEIKGKLHVKKIHFFWKRKMFFYFTGVWLAFKFVDEWCWRN